MKETLIFIDAGFLSKLSRHFGNRKYLKYDLIKFSKLLSKKENLICKKIFYYNAPPFQSGKNSIEETKRKEKYDKFRTKLSKNNLILIREGRCQRLKINGKFIYKQKAVDSLVIMDLMSIPLKYSSIKRIILIASDSDFVPVINYLKELNIKTTLYTYYESGRSARFSTSNHLIKAVNKYVLIKREDFDNCPLEKK